MSEMIIEVTSEQAMKDLATGIARGLKGGEVFELVGDVGAGKTTFVKGLAKGLEIEDDIQSPSFTISRLYDARDNLQLVHYDFYRLNEPGIMANEVAEMVHDNQTITVIEWADIVEGILPENRYTIRFESPSETTRSVSLPDTLGVTL
jgi:tRNA threonylcarbamoyladenosine biosynthesis protein TsaE